MKFILIGVFLLISCQKRVYNKLAPNFEFESYKRALKKVSFIEEIPADILFIIDNSGSMSSHQEQLRKNFKKMIHKIHADPYLDYRVGVINTTARNAGNFMTARNSAYSDTDRRFISKAYLESKTNEAFSDLLNRMIVGINGSGNELIFYPLKKIIEEEKKFKDESFFRKDAFLILIIMTDEDEQFKESYPKIEEVDAREIQAIIRGLKPDSSKVIAFSITSGDIPGAQYSEDPRDNEACLVNKKQGEIVRSFVSELKGTNYSICGDFGKNLDSIGKIIKKRMHLFVPLNRIPVISSIKVYINDELVPNDPKTGWYYDLDAVGIYINPDLKIDGVPIEEMGELDLSIDFVPAKGDYEEAS